MSEKETVRLYTGIIRLAHKPKIIEGRLSTSGKSIMVEYQGKSRRLEANKILSGKSEYRDARYFKLYSKEGFINAVESNTDPYSGKTGTVQNEEDLPKATHKSKDRA